MLISHCLGQECIFFFVVAMSLFLHVSLYRVTLALYVGHEMSPRRALKKPLVCMIKADSSLRSDYVSTENKVEGNSQLLCLELVRTVGIKSNASGEREIQDTRNSALCPTDVH